jgi:enoyl-CoA hydratase
LDEGIMTIVIDRPEKHNVLNSQTLSELKMAVQSCYDDAAVQGIIITGAGKKAFVAGADIAEFQELNELNARKYSENGQEVFELIEHCHKPVVAVVNGFALGGGCELAMACHLRIATENARFGLPEVSLGIIPAFGGTQRLPQLVGKGMAMEMMMTGESIDAEQAEELGLVNYVLTSKESALDKAAELLHKIAKNAPLAVGMTIHCINTHYAGEENGYQTEANSFASCCKSTDFREGTEAFLEKRKPNFTGE